MGCLQCSKMMIPALNKVCYKTNYL
jgi:hypothetical protein